MSGEHRIQAGKVVPYEPSIRVPLLMRGPGVPARRRALAARVERRPRADDPRGGGRAGAVGARRHVAAGRSCATRGAELRARRAARGPAGCGGTGLPTPRFTGLRTPAYVYVEHAQRRARAVRPAARPAAAGEPRRAGSARSGAAPPPRRGCAALRGCAGRGCQSPARPRGQPYVADVVDDVPAPRPSTHALRRLARRRRAPGRPPIRAACAACAPTPRSPSATSARTRRRRGT